MLDRLADASVAFLYSSDVSDPYEGLKYKIHRAVAVDRQGERHLDNLVEERAEFSFVLVGQLAELGFESLDDDIMEYSQVLILMPAKRASGAEHRARSRRFISDVLPLPHSPCSAMVMGEDEFLINCISPLT